MAAVVLENRTRHVFRYPRSRVVERRDGTSAVVLDRTRTLVLGDSDDRDRVGSVRCPSPILETTSEDLAELDPIAMRHLRAMVAAGHIEVRSGRLPAAAA